MPLLTKFPRTKLVSLAATLTGVIAIWAVLAWPDLAQTQSAKKQPSDPNVDAMRALAALSPQQREWLVAAHSAPVQPVPATPPPAQPQVIVRQVYVYRTLPGPTIDGDPPPAAPTGAGSAPQAPQVAPPPRVVSAPSSAPPPAAAPPPQQSVPAQPPPAPPAPTAPAPPPAPPPPPAPAPTAVSKGS